MAENWLVAEPRVDHTLVLGRGLDLARQRPRENWLGISLGDNHTDLSGDWIVRGPRQSIKIRDWLVAPVTNEKFSEDWLVGRASDNHTLMWFRWLTDKVYTLSTFHRQKWTFANLAVKVCGLSLFMRKSERWWTFHARDGPFCQFIGRSGECKSFLKLPIIDHRRVVKMVLHC